MEKAISDTMIDHDLRPAYYDKFNCLITDCQLSCCKDWRITFDRGDYLTLKHTKGSPELNKRLSHALHRIRGDDLKKYFAEFDMSSGICPLLREDGLCLLQVEKGARVQPPVCRSFPRREINTCFGFFEYSLSPACEGVLTLLWDLPEGIDFICNPLPQEKRTIRAFQSTLGFSSGDLQSIRSTCIDILQDRRNPLPERIFLMGIALKQLIDGETDLSRWQANISGMAARKPLNSAGNNAMQMMCLLNNVQVLCSIRQRSAEFQEVQKNIINSLGLPMHMLLGSSIAKISFSKVTASGERISLDGLQEQLQGKSQKSALSAYQTAKARYQEQFGDKEYFMENLMVAVFFHLNLPSMKNLENLWKSYVNFCNTYSFFRFMAVMSCRKDAPGDKKELFRLVVQASRNLLHNSQRQEALAEQFFQNESSTLAHMAVLLSG